MKINIPDKYIKQWTRALADDGWCPPANAAEWAKLIVTHLHPNITQGEQPDEDMIYDLEAF